MRKPRLIRPIHAKEAEELASRELLRDVYDVIRSEARAGTHEVEVRQLPELVQSILKDKGYTLKAGVMDRKHTTIISWESA